jgi:hypothetical protein
MTDNPFLGAKPYGPADDKLFFGRATAAARLVERIDLQPLTILTSPSGLGKTSLLQAAVLPALERNGLSPVYLRPDPVPGEDAAGSLLGGRLADYIAVALLPDAEAEAATLRCARDLAEAATLQRARDLAPPGVTLAGARDWFEALPATDAVRRQILSPVVGPVERLPMLARFLRGSLAPEAMAAQLHILGISDAPRLGPQTPLSVIADIFSGSAFRQALAKAREVARTTSDQSAEDDLQATVKRLCGIPEAALLARSDGDPELSAQIVLVIDQFEQVFTPGRADTRARAFRMLARSFVDESPLHVVLSLRKEWYADLVQQFAQHLRSSVSFDRITFHLEPMTRREALEVMVEAPRQAGARAIERSQCEELWQALQQNETIDAVVLSVACHELFAVGEGVQSAIGEARVEGLLRTYLSRALGAIDDDAVREEAFDILGEVAGEGDTRKFVDHSSLLNAPLRDRQRRIQALDALQTAFLVKGDNPRHGFDKVYDIMHERLLAPVRELLKNRPDIALFREAAERIVQEDAFESHLNWRQCQALLGAGRRAVWNSRTAGIMLSSLVRQLDSERLAAIRPRDGERAGLMPRETEPIDWLRDLAEASARSADPDCASITDRVRLSWWMTAEEIAARVAAPPDLAADLLALQTGLQGPRGWMQQELQTLASRLCGEVPRRE